MLLVLVYNMLLVAEGVQAGLVDVQTVPVVAAFELLLLAFYEVLLVAVVHQKNPIRIVGPDGPPGWCFPASWLGSCSPDAPVCMYCLANPSCCCCRCRMERIRAGLEVAGSC